VLAAIHHQLGKHHVAAMYLTTALAQQQAATCKQQGLPNSSSTSSSSQDADKRQQGSGKQRQASGKQQGGKGNKAKAQPAAADPQQQQQDALEPRGSRWLLPEDSSALQYNLGLQQLALLNWQGAVECFEAASCSLYMQPLLWLRLAEATISLYHEQQEQQQELMQQAQQNVAQQQQQQQRPVLIQVGRQQHSKQQKQQQHRAGSSDAAAKPGAALLQQAAEQLSTGLALLRQQQAEAAQQAEEAAAAMTAAAAAAAAAGGLSLAEQQGSAWLGAASHSSLFGQADAVGGGSDFIGCSSSSTPKASPFGAAAAPSVAACLSGVSDSTGAATAAAGSISPLDACLMSPHTPALQQALLANQAYVHLLLQQPLPALEAAKALLACSSMSPQQHYLGSCYAAEALCFLGRTDDAAEQLQGHMALYMSSSPAAAAATAGAGGFAEHGSSSSVTADALSNVVAAAAMSGVALVPASSIMSDDDGSCAGCKGSGPCSVVLGPSHSSAGSSSIVQQRERQAAVLCNMSSVLAAQGGDLQESRRYAALAAAHDPGCGAAQLMLEVTGSTAVQLGGKQM
jgi:hypothetical protein